VWPRIKVWLTLLLRKRQQKRYHQRIGCRTPCKLVVKRRSIAGLFICEPEKSGGCPRIFLLVHSWMASGRQHRGENSGESAFDPRRDDDAAAHRSTTSPAPLRRALVRFASDLPLEGAGFDLSVPREGKLRSRDCRVDRDGIFSRKGAGSVRSAGRFEPFPPPPRSVLGTHSRAVGCRITRPSVVVSCSRTIRL